MDERIDDLELAARVAEGTAIDWRALREQSGTSPRLNGLEAISAIERLHAGSASDPSMFPLALHESLRDAHARLGNPSTPLTWGPFTIVDKIGHGTFGDVYRAREARLDREVALKLLRRRHENDDAHIIEEARLLARVRHPNVTTVYGADAIDGRVGIWMELVEGLTLEDEIRQQGPFSAAQLRDVATQIGSAIAAVHQAGLLHRDIKAQNVIHATEWRYVLADIGTGVLGRSSDRSGIEMGGSPLYIAPEVLTGAAPTVQNDVYALGVLLFHLASGEFPVQASSIDELRAGHQAGVPSIATRRRDLPRDLVRVIDRALSPVSDRYRDLSALLRDVPGNSSRGRGWIWIAAAAAVITAVTAVATWLSAGVEPAAVPDAVARAAIAVSPDGRMLAYVKSNDLAVYSLATGETRVLTAGATPGSTDLEAAQTAAFSRDSQRIAYAWVTPATEVVHIRVVKVDEPGRIRQVSVQQPFGWAWVHDWSPDGSRILATLDISQVPHLAVIDVDTGASRLVKRLDWRGTTRAAFSTDGRFIAFDQVPSDLTAQRDVFVMPADGSNLTGQISGPSRDQVVGWSSDNRRLFILSDRAGTFSLWTSTIRNGVPEGPLTLASSDVRDDPLGVTTDGRFFYRFAERDQRILKVMLDPATGRRVSDPIDAMIPALANYRRPKWSPDGRLLAAVSSTSINEPTRVGQRLISMQANDDGSSRTLSLPFVQLWTYSWSPNGATILTRARDYQGRLGIFRVDVGTGQSSPVLIGDLDVDVTQPQWTNDGRSFYYTRVFEIYGVTDRDVLVKRDLRTGMETTCLKNADLRTPEGGRVPPIRDWVVSPDETLAAGIAPGEKDDEKYSVWFVKLGSKIAHRLFEADSITHNALVWAPRHGGALIANAQVDHAKPRDLWWIPVDGRTPPHRIDLGVEGLINDAIALSPDGRQLAFKAGSPPRYRVGSVK